MWCFLFYFIFYIQFSKRCQKHTIHKKNKTKTLQEKSRTRIGNKTIMLNQCILIKSMNTAELRSLIIILY